MSILEKRLKPLADYKGISEKGPTFSDKGFQPNTVALGDDADMREIIKKGVKWRRIQEIFKSFKLFKGIDLNDVIQGELGDCYYIAAVTSVSEYPGRITKLFLVNKENKHGCYAVNLYVCGSLCTIIVDDYFPAFGSKWALTSSKDEEIWVMVLEKAWAKVHGNYAVTAGGDSRESLSCLTGAPTTLIRHNSISKSELWKLLVDADKRKYAMSTGGATSTKGLYSGHAYSLMGVVELNTMNAGVAQLVHIRNPWGEYEWNGNWSDSSSLWTPELRAQANHTRADDGTFFMSIDDFYNLYSYVFICQCIDSYKRSDVVIEENEACVAFQILSNTKGFFSAHQMTPRMTGEQRCKPLFLELYAFRDQSLVLVKTTVSDNKHLNFTANPAGSNALGTSTIEADLPPGLYIMHAFFQNRDYPKIKYLCFSAYASKAVDLIHLKGKTSVKTITKKELMATMEEYIKKEDINPIEKKVAVGTAYNCPDDHSLVYKSSYKSAFRCDLCKQIASGGCHRCEKCNYDVCTTCRPASSPSVPPSSKEEIKTVKPVVTLPNKYQPPPPKNVSCSNGHTLECKLVTYMSGRLFICSGCSDVVRFSGPRWVCEKCYYYLCEKCRAPASAPAAPAVQKPTVVKEYRCARSHKLDFVREIYPENAYCCDRCDREGECSRGRWGCLICNYDLCTRCAPDPGPESSIYEKSGKRPEPVADTITTMCEKKHLLWYSKFLYLSGEFDCNKCTSRRRCEDGRWLCDLCEYDICLECRPPPPDVEKYEKSCCNGHLMTRSQNKYNSQSDFYRCAFCDKAKRMEEKARWWCPICGYDICEDCADLDIENMEFPEPLDDEERWCKDDKHEFIKSRGVVESFMCQKDEEDKENQSSYTCQRCGMVQCKECMATSGKLVAEPGDKENMELPKDMDMTIEPSAGPVVKLSDCIQS
eukprot:TRINITY_DN3787_c0_g1_i6.p1 TRINITY_DN3787_c0_g1~~TRINITY_DN3787_c0_g1_i6.p1  ORF type:complete len:929 (+),score=272.17 TRINITY_DN3787_c0_g1_i6:165-2951(+)